VYENICNFSLSSDFYYLRRPSQAFFKREFNSLSLTSRLFVELSTSPKNGYCSLASFNSSIRGTHRF